MGAAAHGNGNNGEARRGAGKGCGGDSCGASGRGGLRQLPQPVLGASHKRVQPGCDGAQLLTRQRPRAAAPLLRFGGGAERRRAWPALRGAERPVRPAVNSAVRPGCPARRIWRAPPAGECTGMAGAAVVRRLLEHLMDASWTCLGPVRGVRCATRPLRSHRVQRRLRRALAPPLIRRRSPSPGSSALIADRQRGGELLL